MNLSRWLPIACCRQSMPLLTHRPQPRCHPNPPPPLVSHQSPVDQAAAIAASLAEVFLSHEHRWTRKLLADEPRLCVDGHSAQKEFGQAWDSAIDRDHTTIPSLITLSYKHIRSELGPFAFILNGYLWHVI